MSLSLFESLLNIWTCPMWYRSLKCFYWFFLQTKWCPSPGCDHAVDFIVGGGSYDVTCRCSHSFCWNVSLTNSLKFSFILIIFVCLCSKFFFYMKFISWNCSQCAEEAHRPVDCGTVSTWILKNSAESENMNWYLLNFPERGNMLL